MRTTIAVGVRLFILTTFLLAAGPINPSAARQKGSEAFSRLDLSVSGVENVNRVGMHRRWKPTTGGAVQASTPFYAGMLEFGARYVPLDARTADVPSYTALLVYGGWNAGWSPVRPLRLSVSIRSGVLRMQFDEDTFAGVATENELSVGMAGRVDVFLSRRLGLYAEVTAERTFTALPIDWAHGAAGLVVRMDTPAWFRRVLE